MRSRSFADWLRWQESLHPESMELGLARCGQVAARLDLTPPAGRVFTVAGTNGKGSTVSFLEAILRGAGCKTGTYTSPHLVRYTERLRIDGQEVSEQQLIAAFEDVERARRDIPLTYFEYGTLAALRLFSRAHLDTWILEVGLGGRLDAVNIIDADVALITTVDLDHQAWLGNDLESIAAEKAGIMRTGRPALYGDAPVPVAIRDQAAQLGAPLLVSGEDFAVTQLDQSWAWRGRSLDFANLPLPPIGDAVQLRNASLALAAVEAADKQLLSLPGVTQALRALPPPGRFQRVAGSPEWVLDVAHNPQAASLLASRCSRLQSAAEISLVFGMLADKSLDGVVDALMGIAPARWIYCEPQDPRALPAAAAVDYLRAQNVGEVHIVDEPVSGALALARRLTKPHGRVVVTGSFGVVGPAMEWLGLY